MKRSAYAWPGSTWTVGLDSMINKIEKLNNQESVTATQLDSVWEDSYAIEIAVADSVKMISQLSWKKIFLPFLSVM